MNGIKQKMNGGDVYKKEIHLSAAYPRMALALLAEYGFETPWLLRELDISPDVLEADVVAVENHYRILEFARVNVARFRVLMAERCGVNTLGPLLPVILGAGCARQAWLLTSQYIPVLDYTAQIEMVEHTSGVCVAIRHDAISDANALDFAFAAVHMAATIVAAGLSSTDFKISADYYNMGELGDTIRWGEHLAKEDSGARRVEVYIPDEVADKPWHHSTPQALEAEQARLAVMLNSINAMPSLKSRIEKGYASSKVAAGKPLNTPEQAAEYFHMEIGEINKRLEKYDTTLKKIFMTYATRWAVVLIQDTDKTLDEINDLTYQLSTGSNFTRTLKKRTGKTFTEIRENRILSV